MDAIVQGKRYKVKGTTLMQRGIRVISQHNSDMQQKNGNVKLVIFQY